MNDKHGLIAYLATLAALVIIVIAGIVAASFGVKLEPLGIVAAVTGVIGLAGTFKPRTNQAPSEN